MSFYIPEKLGQTDFDSGYIPFPAAIELGVVDPENLELHRLQEVISALNSGYMPEKGGTFYDPTKAEWGGIGAADFQAYRQDGKKFEILPTTKDAVDAETHHIQDKGGVFLSFPNGLVRLMSVAVDSTWHIPRKAPRTRTPAGIIVVALGLEAQDLELTDVDETGMTLAKKRVHQVAMPTKPKYKS